MLNNLNQFKNMLSNDQQVLNSLRNAKDEDSFNSLLDNQAKAWGYSFDKEAFRSTRTEESDSISLGLSREQIEANPSYSEFNGCTDNSNMTAQRPSACQTCT